VNVSYVNLTSLVPTQDANSRVPCPDEQPRPGVRAHGRWRDQPDEPDRVSNEFHGSLYEFLRNKVLNANTFFNNKAGVARPAFTQNQYGGRIGGPWKKDKTFFFFSYEGFKTTSGRLVYLHRPDRCATRRRFLQRPERLGRADPDLRYADHLAAGSATPPAHQRHRRGGHFAHPIPGNMIPAKPHRRGRQGDDPISGGAPTHRARHSPTSTISRATPASAAITISTMGASITASRTSSARLSVTPTGTTSTCLSTRTRPRPASTAARRPLTTIRP